jgi:hypothetical protein
MTKSYLASVASFLLWAGVTFGQAPDAPALPAPQNLPVPPAAPVGSEGIDPACYGQPSAAGRAVFTGSLEYVLWFFANTTDALPVATNGNPALFGTSVLGAVADNEREKKEPASGARLTLGYWLLGDNFWVPNNVRDLGAEATFFFVGEQSARFVDQTSPTIFRPFFDANNHVPSGFPVAAPGFAAGGVAARVLDRLWGGEVNVWKNVYYDYPGTTCGIRVMAGARYLDLEQSLDIASISRFSEDLAAFPAFHGFEGNTLRVADSFATHNRFYGAQVGIGGQSWPMYGLVLEADLKLAIGATSEDLTIAGGQVRTLPGGVQIVSPAGLLALASNSGHFHHDKFTQVPEADVKGSIPLSSHLTLTTGFTCLYWSRLLRPAQQIDRALDITQIPNFPPGASATPTGLNQPGVPFRQSDLWVLGVTFGLEVTW